MVGAVTVVGAVPAIETAVFVALFVAITVVGLAAGRWRRGDLRGLDEWGLAGRQFGGIVTWFLQGGSIYTTYSFIAVPALVYGTGVLGFYALPYLVLAYLVQFLVLPPLWRWAKARGHLTPADFVQERFGSSLLAGVVAVTGILSLVPYVALQVYGIQICLSQIGIPVEVALFTAFALLALITYVSGLRAAALIAMVKDVLIWTTVVVAVIYIPIHLGGLHHVLAQVPKAKLTLGSGQVGGFVTLAIGSGFALFLYPHSLTGSLSAKGPRVVRDNAITLPVYTIMLGLLGLLGYMAIAAGIRPDAHYGPNVVVPALFQKEFASPFAGFALAAVAIGALVPASVMSIAAGNLFGRNVYRLARPAATDHQQAKASKLASLVVKFLGVIFIVAIPSRFVINYQLTGGVWILQTLPALFLAPWLRALRKWPVLAGWAAGMAWGTWILAQDHFKTTLHHFSVPGVHASLFVGIPALLINLGVTVAGSAGASLVSASTRSPAPAVAPSAAPAMAITDAP